MNILFMLPLIFYGAVSLPLVEVTVDLSQEDQKHAYRMGTRDWHGFMYIAYYPKSDCEVTKICHGDQVLWDKSKNPQERLRNFKFYYLYGDLRVGFIHIFNGQKYEAFYFKKGDDGKWNKTSYEELACTVTKMKRCREIDVDAPIPEEIFSIQEYAPFGIPAFICMPWPGYIIQAVRAGRSLLWEADGDHERCEHVILHGAIDRPELVHIFIARDNGYDLLYYEREDEMWHEMDKEEFYEKLNELDRMMA